MSFVGVLIVSVFLGIRSARATCPASDLQCYRIYHDTGLWTGQYTCFRDCAACGGTGTDCERDYCNTNNCGSGFEDFCTDDQYCGTFPTACLGLICAQPPA